MPDDFDRLQTLCRLLTTSQLRDYRRALSLDWSSADRWTTRRFCRDRIRAIDDEVARRDGVLAAARHAHANGATHDCGEWADGGACAICGRSM